MKNFLFLLTILFSGILFSQVPENIKNKDTIYFYFDHGKYQKCTYCDAKINAIKKNREHYKFKIDSLHYFTFIFNLMPQSDGKILDVKTLKKSFLRRNKDIIINIDEILEYGMENIANAFYTKVIYIIDSKEIKCGKVIAREVYFRSSFDH